MFDDKDIRSILEDAQEEVPASVWEGVEAGLDKAAHHRTVVLWWRRAGLAGAAAAAIAAMLLVRTVENSDGQLVPQGSPEMIAVVEPESIGVVEQETAADTLTEDFQEMVYVAQALETPAASQEDIMEQTVPTETPQEETIQVGNVPQEPEETTAPAQSTWVQQEWEEDDEAEPVRKNRTSFVLSGLAGTNGTPNKGGKSMIRKPALSTSPMKTGIRETSTNSVYGVPVSLGAGIRIELSPRWSLGTGINYTMLSRRFYGTYTKVNEEGKVENSTSADISNTQHYIGIPVNAYFNILENKNVNFYAYAGGTVEKCVSDRYKVLSTSILHTEKVKGVQLSAGIGLGVEFSLGKHLGLYIDPSLRYYFDCGQPKSIRTAQPLMPGFEIGLKARL